MFTPKMLLLGLAVLMLTIYLPALADPKGFNKAVKKMMSDISRTRILGGIFFIIAFIFLSVHWKLEGGWIMTISIIGWLIFIKGLIFIWNPEYIKKMNENFHKSESATTLAAVLGIIISIALIYIAFNLVSLGEVAIG